MPVNTASKGYTDILFLAIAAFFGILLAAGFSVIANNPQNTPITAVISSPTPYAMHKSLQLSTFAFTTATPAPTRCTGNFNNLFSTEPSVLFAWDPPANSPAVAHGKIKVWATDEHGVTIGQSGNGAVATSSTLAPDHANPAPVGDLSAKDCGPGTIQTCQTGELPLPVFPAIFLLDLTTNPNAVSSDALNGTPHPVNEVFGTWKKLADNNPPANGTILGPGSDPFPPVPFPLTMPNPLGKGHETELGAELIWNVDQLGLTPGHTYSAVFVVHDGDNHPGADLGIGCTTISF